MPKEEPKSLNERIEAIEDEVSMFLPTEGDIKAMFSKLAVWHSLKKIQGKKMICNDFNSFHHFFDGWFRDARVDYFTKKLMQNVSGEWEPQNISVLRSIMHDVGYDRAFVEDHLNHWIATKTPELLIDVPEYDGEDTISQISACMKCSDFNQDEVTAILKQWMSGVWRRFLDHTKQNQFLLIRGKQGIGKDWIIRLICSPLGPYFSNFTMQSQEKDVYDQVTSALVVNMSEFDQTEKFNVAFLKDLITKYQATFRPPYGRDTVTRKFHCSFIGTTNQQYIMRDETGSRRFMILDVQDIDWDAMQKIDYMKAWSQARTLCVDEYKVSNDLGEKIFDIMDQETPENDLEQNVIALWNEAMGARLRHRQKERLRYIEVQDIFNDIRKSLNIISIRVIQSIIKKNNAQQKLDGVRWYRLVPTYETDKGVPRDNKKNLKNLPNYALINNNN